MADSDALRTRRARKHRAGDHSLCGECDQRMPTGLGWPTTAALARAVATAEAFFAKGPRRRARSGRPYVPRSKLSPGELAAVRARDRQRLTGRCSRCGKPMAVSKGSLPPDRRACRECRKPEDPGPQVCQLCDGTFERRRPQPFCSQSCSNAWKMGARPPWKRVDRKTRDKAKSRARHLRHAETWDGIADDEILERDGWRCGICRKRIGKSFKNPHPRSASIDHIVPLSLGGDDTAANKRAAHLGCNMARGNKMGAEQVALFGVIREAPLITRVSGNAVVVRPRKPPKPSKPCRCGAESAPGSRWCAGCLETKRRRASEVLRRIEERRAADDAREQMCQEIRQLCAQGIPQRAVAEQVGTSHRMVVRVLHADPVTGRLPR